MTTRPSSPLIGIVSYGKTKDPKRYTLPTPYVEAVRRARGRLLIIPPGEVDVRPYIDLFDGFILAGGGDIDARHFGQAPHPTMSDVDPERDTTEIELAREVSRRRMPLLAVCRGIQVLNVALGGDLVQHITESGIPHTQGTGEIVIHSVRVREGCLLARVCGEGIWQVGSKHHQAVGRLGRGLEAVAWSEDGVVEAIEDPDHPDALAVQWHPEETAAQDRRQQALFDWLVERAAAYRSRGD